MPGQSKILTLPKRLKSGVVYGAQNRLFEFLESRGVIDPSSIQGGNVFASLEALIPQSTELPAIKIAIINIARFLEEEKPSLEFLEDYEQEVDQDYTDPDKEYSTELVEVMSLYNYYGY